MTRTRRLPITLLCAAILALAASGGGCAEEARHRSPALADGGSTVDGGGGTHDLRPGDSDRTEGGAGGNDGGDWTEGGGKADASPPDGLVPSNALYVSLSGDDSNPGTQAQPFKTVNKGISVLQAGSTLVITKGEYKETTYQIHNKHGSATAWITIRGAPGQRPRLVGSDTWKNMHVLDSSYIQIQGLELYGRADIDHSTQNTGVSVVKSHHIRVHDVWAHHHGEGGVTAEGSNHMDIRGNRIWGNSNWGVYNGSALSMYRMENRGGGNDAAGYSIYLVGNMVWDNECKVTYTLAPQWGITDGNCIIMDLGNDSGFTGRTLIANNLCVDNGARGIHMLNHSNVDVINNTLYQNVRSSAFSVSDSGELSAQGSSTSIRFINNLVWPRPNKKKFLDTYNAATPFTAGNLWIGMSGAAPDAASGGKTAPDALLVNPTLDPRQGDFRPGPGSPAVKAGVPSAQGVTAPATDLAGKQRPSPPSIGALEP